jgi:hypothetical protein
MSSEGIYLDYLPSSSFNVEFLVLLYIHVNWYESMTHECDWFCVLTPVG